MPFAVEQANATTLTLVIPLFLFLILMVCSGYRHPGPVLTGTALGFGSVAAGFALCPFNPFGGYLDVRRGGGRSPKPNELSVEERRVLASCYDPQNRRKAAAAVLGVCALALTLWRASLLFGLREFVGSKVAPIQLAAALAGLSLVLAGWVGLCALTYALRSSWKQVISKGPSWPIDREFPGPWRETISSFFTGRLPEFISSNVPH